MASNNNTGSRILAGNLMDRATDSVKWADQRMALLNPHETWNPDFATAHARLCREITGRQCNFSRIVGWSMVLATASLIVGLLLTSAPTPRVLAQRCIDCSIAVWQAISPTTVMPAQLTPVNDRRPAQELALRDTNDTLIRISDLKGKVVIVNFWATWCGGCKVEIPWFVEFYERYKSRGLEVVGVSLDSDGWKSVRPFLKEKSIPYTIVIGNDTTANKFNVTAMPVTMLIDREGRVAATHTGVPAKSTYESDIQTLLK